MTRNPCILNDVTRCIGCGECVAACKEINDLPLEDPPPRVGRSRSGLSATCWTSIVRRPEGANVRLQCRHCMEPACVSLCPAGALQKSREGPVIFDKALCIGCRYCSMGCPYGIPQYEWNGLNPSVRKCILCFDKLAAGEIDAPACVRECPKEATSFGSRETMLAEARRRIAAEPGHYIDHIWGEQQVGGTSVLYISHVDLSFLAWQETAWLVRYALPGTSWAAPGRVPVESAGMGVLMAGVWWIIDRRMRLQGEGDDDPVEGTTKSEDGDE